MLPIQNAAGVMEHAGMGMPMDRRIPLLLLHVRILQQITGGLSEQLTLTLAIQIILIVPAVLLTSMDMAVVGVGVAAGVALLSEP